MGLDLLTILTGQGQICEVLVVSQLFESRADIVTEVVPLKTQLLIRPLHLGMFWMQLISITQSGTNIDLEKFQQQITSNPFQVGLAWVEPRLLFNNIFDWDVRRSVKVTFVSNVFGKKVQFSRPMKS